MNKNLFWFLVGVVILGASAGIYRYLVSTKNVVEKNVAVKPLKSLRTLRVRFEQSVPEVSAWGSVRVRNKIPIRTRVFGEISWLHPNFFSGGVVFSDEVIVKIDDADYILRTKQAEVNVNKAKIQIETLDTRKKTLQTSLQLETERLDISRKEEVRFREMLSQNTVSQQAYDQIYSQFRDASQKVQSWITQIELNDMDIKKAKSDLELSILALETAKLDLARCVIKSPASGKIIQKNISRGEFVQTNTILGELVDMENLDLEVKVSTDDFNWVQSQNSQGISETLQARVEMVSNKISSFTLPLERISATLDPATRTWTLWFRIPNDLGKDPVSWIHPESFANVTLISQRVIRSAKIPFVAVKDGKIQVVRHKKIETIEVLPLRNLGDVYLFDKGISDGEEVVRVFNALLRDGEEIQSVEAEE